MKHRLASVLVFSLLMAGCSSMNTRDSDKAGEQISSTSIPISEEEFNKIPKNLRPEELEQRNDTTVVIRSGDRRTLKEYRIGGFIYAIQVIPKIGPPYLLIPADNQGNFMRSDGSGMLIPSWTLFEWQ